VLSRALDITREKMDAAIRPREAGVKLAGVFSNPQPLQSEVRRLVQDGAFGRVLYADLSGRTAARRYYPTADWRGTVPWTGCLMNRASTRWTCSHGWSSQPVVEVTILGSRIANIEAGTLSSAPCASPAGAGAGALRHVFCPPGLAEPHHPRRET
jgi:hypothetical protein